MPFFLVYFWKYMTTPPKVYFRDILLQHYLYYFPIKAAKVAPLNWNHHSQNPCEKATFFCPPTPLKSFSIRRGQLILGNRFIFFIPWTIKQEADIKTFINKVCVQKTLSFSRAYKLENHFFPLKQDPLNQTTLRLWRRLIRSWMKLYLNK